MSTMKQLRAAGDLLRLDCGDNSCLFTPRWGGMRTNGGCTCDLPATIELLQIKCVSTANERDQLQARLTDLIEAASALADKWGRGTHDDGTPEGYATACTFGKCAQQLRAALSRAEGE